MDEVVSLGEAAKAMMEKNPVTIEDKWEIVKPYYERSYKIKFDKRPPDVKINWLYEQMKLLTENLKREFQRGSQETKNRLKLI